MGTSEFPDNFATDVDGKEPRRLRVGVEMNVPLTMRLTNKAALKLEKGAEVDEELKRELLCDLCRSYDLDYDDLIEASVTQVDRTEAEPHAVIIET